MANRCKACLHPKRTQLDAALAGGASQRVIASRFGVSQAGVNRHRAHMAQLVTATPTVLHPNPNGFIESLRGIVVDLQRIAQKAEAAKDFGPAVAAQRELTRVVDIVVRAVEAQAERERSKAGELTEEELLELIEEARAELARRRTSA